MSENARFLAAKRESSDPLCLHLTTPTLICAHRRNSDRVLVSSMSSLWLVLSSRSCENRTTSVNVWALHTQNSALNLYVAAFFGIVYVFAV